MSPRRKDLSTTPPGRKEPENPDRVDTRAYHDSLRGSSSRMNLSSVATRDGDADRDPSRLHHLYETFSTAGANIKQLSHDLDNPEDSDDSSLSSTGSDGNADAEQAIPFSEKRLLEKCKDLRLRNHLLSKQYKIALMKLSRSQRTISALENKFAIDTAKLRADNMEVTRVLVQTQQLHAQSLQNTRVQSGESTTTRGFYEIIAKENEHLKQELERLLLVAQDNAVALAEAKRVGFQAETIRNEERKQREQVEGLLRKLCSLVPDLKIFMASEELATDLHRQKQLDDLARAIYKYSTSNSAMSTHPSSSVTATGRRDVNPSLESENDSFVLQGTGKSEENGKKTREKRQKKNKKLEETAHHNQFHDAFSHTSQSRDETESFAFSEPNEGTRWCLGQTQEPKRGQNQQDVFRSQSSTSTSADLTSITDSYAVAEINHYIDLISKATKEAKDDVAQTNPKTQKQHGQNQSQNQSQNQGERQTMPVPSPPRGSRGESRRESRRERQQEHPRETQPTEHDRSQKNKEMQPAPPLRRPNEKQSGSLERKSGQNKKNTSDEKGQNDKNTTIGSSHSIPNHSKIESSFERNKSTDDDECLSEESQRDRDFGRNQQRPQRNQRRQRQEHGGHRQAVEDNVEEAVEEASKVSLTSSLISSTSASPSHSHSHSPSVILTSTSSEVPETYQDVARILEVFHPGHETRKKRGKSAEKERKPQKDKNDKYLLKYPASSEHEKGSHYYASKPPVPALMSTPIPGSKSTTKFNAHDIQRLTTLDGLESTSDSDAGTDTSVREIAPITTELLPRPRPSRPIVGDITVRTSRGTDTPDHRQPRTEFFENRRGYDYAENDENKKNEENEGNVISYPSKSSPTSHFSLSDHLLSQEDEDTYRNLASTYDKLSLASKTSSSHFSAKVPHFSQVSQRSQMGSKERVSPVEQEKQLYLHRVGNTKSDSPPMKPHIVDLAEIKRLLGSPIKSYYDSEDSSDESEDFEFTSRLPFRPTTTKEYKSQIPVNSQIKERKERGNNETKYVQGTMGKTELTHLNRALDALQSVQRLRPYLSSEYDDDEAETEAETEIKKEEIDSEARTRTRMERSGVENSTNGVYKHDIYHISNHAKDYEDIMSTDLDDGTLHEQLEDFYRRFSRHKKKKEMEKEEGKKREKKAKTEPDIDLALSARRLESEELPTDSFTILHRKEGEKRNIHDQLATSDSAPRLRISSKMYASLKPERN